MKRTIVVTGAAPGIGRATSLRLTNKGHRILGVDLRGADVNADLGTDSGRARMLDELVRLSPNGIDGVLAAAGIAKQDAAREMIAFNFFGAVATLKSLRPLLARSRQPRAVAICSTAAMLPGNPAAVDACLERDEAAALMRASENLTPLMPIPRRRFRFGFEERRYRRNGRERAYC